MATRIKLFKVTTPADTDRHIVTGSDGEQNLQPPANLKWTVVELRMSLSGAGKWDGRFDTEKYYEGRQEIDFLVSKVPHTVAIDIVKPHFLEIGVTSDGGAITAIDEIVLEESPVTA